MYKWSLIFHNPNLEEQYQTGLKHQVRKHVFIGAILALLIIIGYDLLTQVTTGDYFHLIFDLIFLGITFIGGCIVWKRQFLLKYALILINFVISSVQFQMDPHIEQQYNFIFGQSIMASHIIITSTSDFKYSLFQILCLVIIRTVIMYVKTTTTNIQMYCFIIIIMLFEIYVQYITDLAQRKQFLLMLKENHWEKYLSNLIRKPFYLFHFKDEIFQLIKQNEQEDFIKINKENCDGCNLRDLLRQCQINNNKTLEFQILESIEQLQKGNIDEQIHIGQIYEIKIHSLGYFKITFQQFVSEVVEFILILDEFIPYSQFQSEQKNNLKFFITQQIKSFQKIRKLPNKMYIKLLSQNLTILSILNNKDNIVQEFDMVQIFKKLKLLIRLQNMILVHLKTQQILIGKKKFFIIFFSQVLLIIKHLDSLKDDRFIVQIEPMIIFIKLPSFCLNPFLQLCQQNQLIQSSLKIIEIVSYKDFIKFQLNDQIFQHQ